MPKENMNEQDSWVTIEKYRQYQVNPMGQIRKIKTGNIIKAYRKYRRYIVHIIDDNGKVAEPDVDRIVADAFLPKLTDNTNMLLKHLDGNLNNCYVDNLAWVDDDTAEKEYYSTHSIRKPKEYFKFYPLLECPEGYYEINKMGQIRNRIKHRLVKNQIVRGYPVYVLKINGRYVYRFAHVLVAKQFIPNPENKPIVNHIDEDRANACVDNLEWVTNSENSSYGTGASRANLGRNKMLNEYDVHGKYIRTWKSIRICTDFFDTLYPDQNNKEVIRSILNFNTHHETEKKAYANRVFMFYKGNCDDIHFKSCIYYKSRKHKDANLDGIVVPNEYLFDDNDNLILLSILKGLPSSKLGFTKIQKEALKYAIKCAEIIEHDKSKYNNAI